MAAAAAAHPHKLPVLLTIAIAILLMAYSAAEAEAAGIAPTAKLMFVFGSSYADTGNVKKLDAARPFPWAVPYGRTWPGIPSGRYSDGHVLSDVLASAVKAAPAVSYAQLVGGGGGGVNGTVGINFAVGGSGVLGAYGYPPISAQIDEFQGVAAAFKAADLAAAVVLYTTAGDDYYHYLNVEKGPIEGIYPLTVSVGKQISADLIRLYQLGLRKFAVTYLPPTGCLPIATKTSFYQSCNDTWTANVAQPHNARVFKNALGLRHYFLNGSLVNLDLYSAFLSAQSALGGLKPCCSGNTAASLCSSFGADGAAAFSVCNSPSSRFYWDDLIHPTEAGWKTVVNSLQSALAPLLS